LNHQKASFSNTRPSIRQLGFCAGCWQSTGLLDFQKLGKLSGSLVFMPGAGKASGSWTEEPKSLFFKNQSSWVLN